MSVLEGVSGIGRWGFKVIKVWLKRKKSNVLNVAHYLRSIVSFHFGKGISPSLTVYLFPALNKVLFLFSGKAGNLCIIGKDTRIFFSSPINEMNQISFIG
jgi:hypothetical protein